MRWDELRIGPFLADSGPSTRLLPLRSWTVHLARLFQLADASSMMLVVVRLAASVAGSTTEDAIFPTSVLPNKYGSINARTD